MKLLEWIGVVVVAVIIFFWVIPSGITSWKETLYGNARTSHVPVGVSEAPQMQAGQHAPRAYSQPTAREAIATGSCPPGVNLGDSYKCVRFNRAGTCRCLP